MSDPLKYRICFSLFAAVTVFWLTYRSDPKPRTGVKNMSPQYDSVLNVFMFPMYLAIFYVSICSRHDGDLEAAHQYMFSICFMIFLHLSIYYGVLLAVLPILRSRFRARTCAILWLIPCILSVFFAPSGSDEYLAMGPMLNIPVSSTLVSALSKIWIRGFWMILIWKIASHLLFSQRIEASAQKITNPEILQIWEQEQQATGEYPLLISPILQSTLVQTPLSIGVFKMNTILVLPQKEYSQEELELIFRHEIIHIQRRDGTTKFFLAFCAALCWFNPLLWLGIRRSAEDMELSCDEAVVQNYTDKFRRHQYAKLLLKTAGDERGFTSCLAANASALRYRLANIIAPQSRKSGALLAALITFGMLMSIGCVGLSIQ